MAEKSVTEKTGAEKAKTYTASVQTPVGPLTVVERDNAIVSVNWGKAKREDETPLLAAAKAQLDGYFFCGLRKFELPLKPEGTEFDKQVWQAMLDIPYGRTRTYGEVASEIGGTARDVGAACGHNPIPIFIPCHRIVGADGAMVGYSGGAGVESKVALLALEGVLLPL
jgi:methylated-DNA-[protein]-cysteine S-methyltransferase